MPAIPHRSALRAAIFVLLGFALAGCDKCGNRVNISVPSLQKSCGDNAQPAR